jgi:hypothetical protein
MRPIFFLRGLQTDYNIVHGYDRYSVLFSMITSSSLQHRYLSFYHFRNKRGFVSCVQRFYLEQCISAVIKFYIKLKKNTQFYQYLKNVYGITAWVIHKSPNVSRLYKEAEIHCSIIIVQAEQFPLSAMNMWINLTQLWCRTSE